MIYELTQRFKIEVENVILGRDSHDAPFSKCKVEVHTILLPKPSIFHQSYSIDANTIQGLLIYFCLRVLKWLVAYLFEVCGVLIKFLLKKWTLGAKKWHFNTVFICLLKDTRTNILKLHVIFQLL